jgi:hypothetical protein
MTMRTGADLGWLAAFVASWAAPLIIDAFTTLRYRHSLLIWAIPIAYLWPFFISLTDRGARRRRALWRTVLAIAGLGIVLDFVIGSYVLRFRCDLPDHYWACLPGLRFLIPVEEVLFYLLAPAAIVLTYACADEYWFADAARQRRRHEIPGGVPLLRVEPRLLITMIALLSVAVVVAFQRGSVPTYFVFLVLAAIGPAVLLYSSLRDLVNWQAFAATMFYVVATSVMWEVTLALPREWWNYRTDRMLVSIDAWSQAGREFPVEAAIVWVCAPFSCILIFEFARALLYHPAPTVRGALRGTKTRRAR